MHPLAWILALGLLSLHAPPSRAPLSARRDSVAQDPAPAPPAASESEALKEARERFARAKDARKRKDLDEARAQAAQAIGVLVGLAPGALSAEEDGILFELGMFARAAADLKSARVAGERVVLERERHLPTDDLNLAGARGNLAVILKELGDLRGARALEQQVLGAFESKLPPDHTHLATARANLASTLLALGEIQAARAQFELVLEVRERTLPADSFDLAVARWGLATTQLTLGDLQAARTLFERVVKVLAAKLPPTDINLAAARGNLAATLEKLGDLPAARLLEESVLEVFEHASPPNQASLATARGNLAATLKSLGDLPAARRLQEQALEALERGPSNELEVGRARLNLAATLESMGDYPAARDLEQEVLEVFKRTLPADHPELAAARGNLADALKALGDFSAARALEELALQALERTLPAEHPHLALARWNLGCTLGALLGGKSEGSREEQARLRSALGSLAIDLARGLRRSARSALLEGSPREAEERLASRDADLGRAISLARGYGIVDLGFEVQCESFLLGESSRAGGLIASRLAALAAGDPVGRELRERIAAETQTLAGLAQSGGSAEDLERARTAIDQAGRELAQHASGLLGSAAAIDPTLEDLTRDLGPADALVAWRKTTISTLQRGDPATWSRVDSLIAFVVRPGLPVDGAATGKGNPRLDFIDLGPMAPIEAAIERWRKRIGTPIDRGVPVDAGGPSLGDLGRDVRARVLDPLHGALQGVERVIAVLDDALHAVPLDALPAGDEWARPGVQASGAGAGSVGPIGDVLRIEVRSSLIERLLPEVPLAGETTLLAIGHPDFDADPASTEELAKETGVLAAAATRSGESAGLLSGGVWERGFGTLPETHAEVLGVAQYFEDSVGEKAPSVLLERRKATREALIGLAPKARWLHVATHGWFATESLRSNADPEPVAADLPTSSRPDKSDRVRGMSPMLLCGLALAGANLPVNAVGRIPGLVTAQEIAALDLSNCELAVLSACETSVGVRRAGQGVASLQKALRMAGARSVITSLWKVPDQATKDLMIDFYRRLWIEKKPKHQALWEAKTKLRKDKDESGKPKYTPRDWAAWVLTGDPN